MDGVLIILKPPGMTSHDVVSFVRRTLGTKRVGHTGTLDPAAAGVLPVCVGQATRLVEYLQGGTKEYIAEATFGYETDTCDAVGQVVSEGDATPVELECLRKVLDGFRGTITQTPPMHSAIKVDGKKLYELAREGNTEVEIPTREVAISQLLASRFLKEDARAVAMLTVGCSGGTYIRSLVRDIGRALGCGATMTFLVRTRSGAFDIHEAHTLEQVAANANANASLIPVAKALQWCADRFVEDDEAVQAFAQGKTAQLLIENWATSKMRARLTGTGEDFKMLRTQIMHAGQIGSRHVAIINSTQTIAAIASPVSDDSGLYKPDKVLFLNP